MAMLHNPRDFLILTNNPLVPACMEGRGLYTLRFQPERSFREILVEARDLVYAGHVLYTHPLAGSVKPNETPYKSLIVSREAHGFDAQHGEMIASAIAVFDKFKPRDVEAEILDPRLDVVILVQIGFDGVGVNIQGPVVYLAFL